VRNLNEAFWSNEALKGVARERFDAFLIKRHACADCPVRCSGIYQVDDLACEGIQANSLRAFGSNVDVACAKDILYAHALCNTLGLDVDQTSAVIAWAMDCFEQGIIDAGDTDGMELGFGDGRCVAAMIRKIANREGFGDLLADGLFDASRKIGRNSEKLAALVKKNGVMEAAMRTHRAWALGIVTSTRGTGHLRGAPGLEFQKLPPEVSMRLFGIDDISEPTAYENKAALVVWQEKYKAVIDMMGLCALITMWMDRSLFTPEDISTLYEDITGLPASPSDLLRAGERLQNLERSFNLLHAGFGRTHDLPPRKFVEIPVNKGAYAGEKIDPAGWNRMLDDYYRLYEWDAATGWPTLKCLSNLGLTDVAEKLRQNGVDLR
jgi:aldehyde:ferredoxin oxidoreductase